MEVNGVVARRMSFKNEVWIEEQAVLELDRMHTALSTTLDLKEKEIAELKELVLAAEVKGYAAREKEHAADRNLYHSAQDELNRVSHELERERLRLAAVGTAALGYFKGCHQDYDSASLQDVLRLYKNYVDAQKALRFAAGLISTMDQFKDKHPEEALEWIKTEAAKS